MAWLAVRMPTRGLPEVQYFLMRSSCSPSSFSRRVNRTTTSHFSRFSRPGRSLSDFAEIIVTSDGYFDSRYFFRIGIVLSDSYSAEPETKTTRSGAIRASACGEASSNIDDNRISRKSNLFMAILFCREGGGLAMLYFHPSSGAD